MRSLLHTVPTDVEQLNHYIRYLLRSRPPLPFSRIIDFHNRHPKYHSIESHNILLGISIKHGLLKTSQSLLNSLSMKQIEPNEDTEKLVIRLLVSRGLWLEAWEQVIQRYSTVQAIPMPIFLELLAPRPPIRQKPSHNRVNENENNPVPCVRSPVAQEAYKLILHRFKEFPPDSLDKVPLRVLSYVVRSFLKSGHESEAIALTENYIKTLPQVISPRKVAHLQALINTHLSTGEIKLTTFKKRRRLIERLCSLHPQVFPNSDTLFLLMHYMARSKQCGTIAYLLYKAYLGKWGSNMDTLQVRGRIIKYAIKEGKHGIARKMSLVSNTLLSKPKEKDSIATESLELRPWRITYPKDGRSRSDFKAVVYKRLRVARQMRRQLERLNVSWGKGSQFPEVPLRRGSDGFEPSHASHL